MRPYGEYPMHACECCNVTRRGPRNGRRRRLRKRARRMGRMEVARG